MLAAETLCDVARTCDMMSDPIRLKILLALEEAEAGELCVMEIGAIVERRQQAVSHHLTILKRQRAVVLRRDGKSNRYSLTERGRAALGMLAAVA